MPDRDGYIPGVPCWVDMNQPDPAAAAEFYGGLFGWDVEDTMPPDMPGSYFMGRIRGRDVAAIGSPPEGAPGGATWNTYVWVDSADDAVAKVREAGGSVITEPFDVLDAGRMAVFADPQGAVLSVWQPGRHRGSQVVNEHGSVNFNDLHTADPDGAKAFYGAVFGWTTLHLGGPAELWTLPGYGDHLEEINPGVREQTREMGGPEGFVDVVASLNPITDGSPPRWGVTFAADDADATSRRAEELGGRVVVPPFDAPWVRSTVLADPQGATFTANQFVPENREVSGPA